LVIVPRVAEIVAVALAETADVVTVNVADVAPGRIVTVVGTEADDDDELTFTVTPLAAAAPEIVRVPVTLPPPETVLALNLSESKAGALTVRVVVRVTPLNVAERVATPFVATGVVSIGKLAVVAPPRTVTLGCTVTKPESEPREI
jgi:hypothetical protein